MKKFILTLFLALSFINYNVYADITDEFQKVYYYNDENKERYENYASINQNMSVEDIVLNVDIGLDKDFYSDVNIIDVTKIDDEKPILVNKYNGLPKDYVPKNLTEISKSTFMTKNAAQNFLKMQSDAKSEGIEFYAASAYRSIGYQKNLYERYLKRDKQSVVDTYSARAGFSEHNTGRAVDICTSNWNLNKFGGTLQSDWVYENCWKYGFIVRYTEENKNITGYISEPWHITYVGFEAAQTMKEKNIKSLEEYMYKYIYYNEDSIDNNIDNIDDMDNNGNTVSKEKLYKMASNISNIIEKILFSLD